MPPLNFKNSNNCAYTDEEKADAIASSLEFQFTRNPIVDYDTEREVNDSVRNF